MILTDQKFFLLVAPLLRVLAKQEPTRRCAELADYAERRARECREVAPIESIYLTRPCARPHSTEEQP